MIKKAGAVLISIFILVIMSFTLLSTGIAAQNINKVHDDSIVDGTIPFTDSCAINAMCEASWSNASSQIDPVKKPTNPKSLTANAGDAHVVLAWSPPANDGGESITNYSVYRGTSPSAEVFLIKLGPILTYTDTGVTNGQTYYYQVTAWNSVGESAKSNEASAIPSTVPTAPQALTASSGDGQITLVWTAPENDGGRPITNYTLYRGTSSGGEVHLVTLGNVLSYIDLGLINGQTYYYKVSAVNFNGESPQSNEAFATPATLSSPPLSLNASPGNAQIILTWTAPSSDGGSAITNYRIYQGTTSGGEVLLTTLGNVLTYSDIGLDNGQTYYYQVSAVNGVGEGPRSSEASAIPMAGPSAPRDLAASSGNESIDLTWTAPTSDGGSPIISYNIYRGTTSGEESLLITIGIVFHYNDSGLINGQTYYYKVCAVNAKVDGALSNEASATPATTPSAPLSLAAGAGNAQVTLTWTVPSSDGGSSITSYKVYRGTATGSEVLLTTLGNVLTYTDTGLTNGQVYYYQVSAVNSKGEGPRSNEASATPVTVPGAPNLSSATPGKNQVALAWTVPGSNGGSAITNYEIYRGLSPGSETLLITLGNVLSYTDTGLTNGQTYYYKVAAVNSVGAGALSNELSAKPVSTPSAPQNLHANSGNAFVNTTWTSPIDNGGSPITNYQVWRGLSSGTEAFLANAGLRLWLNDTGLTNGQTYYYIIIAENAQGLGQNSSEVFATPSVSFTVPTAPQNLAAAPGNAQVVLTWSAPASNGGTPITNYSVYRGVTSGSEMLLVNLGPILTYSDTGLSNGQIYYYKVTARNSVGEGPRSNEASATPITIPSAPQSPAASPGNAQITLTWTAPSSNGGSAITNYRIYRGTISGGEVLLTTVGNVLTYSDLGLINGQSYYYKISAVNSAGEGTQSSELSAVPFTVPTAPSLTSATPSNAQVVLAWTAPSSDGGASISGYKIYRGTSSGGEVFLTTLGNILTFTDTGLTNGQTYYYKVSASNSAGEGAQSNELSARPVGPPTAPQNLQASPGNAFVNLSWQTPSSNGGSAITNYQVLRGLTAGGEIFFANAGLNLWFNDTGLINGQTYYYKVRAVNAQGTGPDSSEASAIPSQTVTVPSAPQGLSVSPGDSQALLLWSAPASSGGAPIINYKLYRGTVPGGETLLTTLGDIQIFTDTGLTNGQTYYYKVSAVNLAGEGPQSNEASATPVTVPSAPVLISALPGNAQVILTWTAPNDDGGSPITNYSIYRGTSSGGEALLIKVGNILTFTDLGLSNGQTYYYQVSAANSVGEGTRSNEISSTPADAPSAPQGLTAVASDAKIALSWVSPANEGGSPIRNYSVYRGIAPGEETLLTTIGNELTYDDIGLSNGQTYYYRVSARNSVGEGPMSDEANATPATVPSAPQGLLAVKGDAQIKLTWSEPSSDGGSAITNYSLYRGTTSGAESLLITLGNTLSYNDTDLTDGQTYFYQVSALNSIGEGPMSNEASVILVSVPSAPQNLIASFGDAEAILAWSSPVSDGGGLITNYTIYRGTTSGNETFLTTIGDTFNYTDIGLSNGQTYYYVVSAVNSAGEGPRSNEVSVTPATVPSAPMNLTVTIGNAQIKLGWSAPESGGSAITNYTVYRGMTSGGELPLATIGNDLSYIDSGLSNGQTYYYKVSATNSVGEGTLSDEAFGTPSIGPSAPQDLVATPGNGQMVLTWTAPSDDGGSPIIDYSVYRGTASGEEVFLVTIGNVLTYLDTGLTNDLTYYYMISAVNSVGEGALSNEALATPATVPSAPLGLQALVGDRSVDLNWTQPYYIGSGTLTYHLYRDGMEVWSGTAMSYLDAPLVKGLQYSYTVAARNSMGIGPISDPALAVPVGVPDNPWGLMVVPGNGQASLSWEETNFTGPGALAYHLFRDGIQIWSGVNSSYLDHPLANGHAYEYQVAASNDIGWSENSSRKVVAPQGPPTAPTELRARAGVGSIQLNWTSPAYSGPGTTLYFVFRDGKLIWSGEELGYLDSGLSGGANHSYSVAALNSIGQGPNCTAMYASALTGGGGSILPQMAAFMGFVLIAAIPTSLLFYQMIRRHYILAVSLSAQMRCPSCGLIIPAASTRCRNCGVKFHWRKIEKENPPK